MDKSLVNELYCQINTPAILNSGRCLSGAPQSVSKPLKPEQEVLVQKRIVQWSTAEAVLRKSGTDPASGGVLSKVYFFA